jgi:hypothetical protein
MILVVSSPSAFGYYDDEGEDITLFAVHHWIYFIPL